MSQLMIATKTAARNRITSPSEGSWSNSRTWRSDSHAITWEWKRVELNLKRMRLDRSEFVPKRLEEYIIHKREMQEIYADELNERLTAQEATRKAVSIFDADVKGLPLSAELQAYAGSLAQDMSATFAAGSVFSNGWIPGLGHDISPWPTVDEYKEEGDERHTSGFGRFLPVPRVAGNPTVTWKQKIFQEPYDRDRVRPVAKLYDFISLPYDHVQHEPTMDDDSEYLDCEWESGREARTDDVKVSNSSVRRSLSSLPINPEELRALEARHQECNHYSPSACTELTRIGATGKLSTSRLQPNESSYVPTAIGRPSRAHSALPAFSVQQHRQLNPDAIEFKSRGSSWSSDASGRQSESIMHNIVGSQTSSRKQATSSSSLGSTFSHGSPGFADTCDILASEEPKSNNYSIFTEMKRPRGLTDSLTRSSSRRLAEMYSATEVEQDQGLRRSTVSNTIQTGQRPPYARNSFSRHDAIFENIPKKYSKGFDEDEYEYCPLTPKAPRNVAFKITQSDGKAGPQSNTEYMNSSNDSSSFALGNGILASLQVSPEMENPEDVETDELGENLIEELVANMEWTLRSLDIWE